MSVPARTLMVQGTMSNVGKSLLVTALCRSYARRGVRVAPFKAQNLSNNAAVCADGGEIGRAQFTQAQAAGIEPTVQMNPVLLKPGADVRSQVVVNGQVWASLPARNYYARKQFLWRQVTAALDSLRDAYDLIVVEGAGSPVELNLRRGDIVNMAVARYAQAPVLLVGDINLGGLFAQLLGTLDLLQPEERTLVRALVVNKFRGDPSLFEDGVTIIEDRGGVPVLGVVPYMHEHGVPDEDAVVVELGEPTAEGLSEVDIAVIRLPRIANFDDFAPLAAERGVRLRYVDSPDQLGVPDAIILPGTKSTIADLRWLSEIGLAMQVRDAALGGTAIVGICGGYQMLTSVIQDPDAVESDRGSMAGLGLLDAVTRFHADKTTRQVAATVLGDTGWMHPLQGEPVNGYEIHMGQTDVETGWLLIDGRRDGLTSTDGRVWGCYLHGLFENEAFRRAWLHSLGWGGAEDSLPSLVSRFDQVADTVEAALDMAALDAIIGLR